ncbi:spermatogenesis-associated protein 20 [Eurytemora carolleeae]|uniref:spermatogenesis-associated protein 20 n=1 Tax=Eurytemora carolleeae TaxID=1294199 RepID=UPI000C790C61|nr:spermatogenesis-associated protein 20 [Eurytemora carolleeae]|eukprot:XP_023343873.1 spermatogenesis-associated protein 20-like [Eurytemora affinis]
MLRVVPVVTRCIRSMSAVPNGNLLGSQLSPYLKQHATNPVQWLPWDQQALQRAKDENKLIFLSIGYSTCHWCHVMERESFENPEVAKIMNENYINIKVDREERPDVDKVYMTFVQATTGGGGWPLSVFLSPDLKPVYGGTYFPPRGAYGRPGFPQVLQALAAQWETEKDDLIEAGTEVLKIMEEKLGGRSTHPGPLPSASIFPTLFAQLSQGYDPEFGGYSKAPKFPQPSNLLTMFKLHCWDGQLEDRKKRGLEMNLHTLKMMDKGGIHDHISQGFARYSTDAKWHVPHFEKMLYDQAQLVTVYSIAAQLTGEDCYRSTVEDILTYVARDLTHPLGGCFSAEVSFIGIPERNLTMKCGNFFLENSQIAVFISSSKSIMTARLLNNKRGTDLSVADVIVHKYNIEEEGNVDPSKDPHGELINKNVLTTLPEKAPICDEELYKSAVERGRQLLYAARQKRPRPALDDKVVLFDVFNIIYFDQEDRLLRSVYGGEGEELVQLPTPIYGFIGDYAFVIQGMLDLYEATFDNEWLNFAVKLQDIQDSLFLDQEQGDLIQLGIRILKYIYTPLSRIYRTPYSWIKSRDGAEPSSNSISAMNLLRLSKLLNNTVYRTKAEEIFQLFTARLTQIPASMPALVDAFLTYHQDGPVLVVKENLSLIKDIRVKYRPFLTIIHLDQETSIFSGFGDLKVEPGEGVLIQATEERIKISSVEELELKIKTGKP